MAGYAARDVAKLLRLSVGQVHAWVRAGFLAPEREPTGEQRFSFQDLVLLRTAKGLMEARIPARRVRRALEQLRRHLPRGRPLSGVQIAADGKRIVVTGVLMHLAVWILIGLAFVMAALAWIRYRRASDA